jgi:LmbE family N-acetylglucosaminyl deacetylase
MSLPHDDTAPLDAIYLSPHLDDAAFSCGAQIHARARRGERVAIVTVFAGWPPTGAGLSSFAKELHRLWGLERVEDVVAVRRDEDRCAAELLGASFTHLGLTDAIYRSDPGGTPLYPAFASLFRDERDGDSDLEARLCDALRALPASAFVAAPLAIGGHVDHRIVHRAARESIRAERLWFYEDFPYAGSWRVRMRAAAGHRGWTTRVELVEDEDFAVKSAAIACYASQLDESWRDREVRERRIRRFHQRRGGERLWRPRNLGM